MTDKKTLPLSVRVEFFSGMPIKSAITNAIKMARRLGCYITFDFNGTHVAVSPDSDPAEVRENYDRNFGDMEDEDSDDIASAKEINQELLAACVLANSCIDDDKWGLKTILLAAIAKATGGPP